MEYKIIRTLPRILAVFLITISFAGCGNQTVQEGVGVQPTEAGPRGTEAGAGSEIADAAEISYEQITQQTAKELMDTDDTAFILDVRTKEEYADGHIPNAVLIPHDEISQRAEAEIMDKEQLILVYCRSGNRSKAASEALAELGYKNVKEFGGINSWPYEIMIDER